MAKAWLAALMVFVGCCSNVVFLELLITSHPGSGNIITFSQFLLVALEGFINEMNFGKKRNSIPLSHYMFLVLMFLSVNVLNNYALNFHIPLPLHMIFRSGSLIANLVLGILLLKKRYSMSKYLAVICITVGISISTIASSTSKQPAPAPMNVTMDSVDATDSAPPAAAAVVPLFERLIGVSMLAFALFVSALMGIYQERMYGMFGKHPHEALFFVHALSLPAFALMWSNIAAHAEKFHASPPLTLSPLLGDNNTVYVPSMWAFLLGNVVTQLLCIKGVYILSSEVSSLVCTLVVTLRKFVSLLFSIYYFENPFSMFHWIGTSLVFGGTIVFLDLVSMIRNQYNSGSGSCPTPVNDVKYTQIKKKE